MKRGPARNGPCGFRGTHSRVTLGRMVRGNGPLKRIMETWNSGPQSLPGTDLHRVPMESLRNVQRWSRSERMIGARSCQWGRGRANVGSVASPDGISLPARRPRSTIHTTKCTNGMGPSGHSPGLWRRNTRSQIPADRVSLSRVCPFIKKAPWDRRCGGTHLLIADCSCLPVREGAGTIFCRVPRRRLNSPNRL